MRIAIGSDHRGLDLKQFVVKLVTEAGHSYQNFGCYSTDAVDYPDIAKQVAEAVAGGDFECGILICDTGIGMCIAANKVKGIRAALCPDTFCAQRARQHNDANILCLGASGERSAVPEIVDAFLTSQFEGERHLMRLDKIRAMES
ncbi:ribose 5-phosphate isomerase B [Chloroflexota bacterium]